MQNVNSINQFEKLKHDLEAEDREIHSLDDSIHRKEIDHKRTKEIFEKVDKELQELHKKKADLIQRRAKLEGDVKNLQRSLEDLKRHGGIPLKL